MLPKKEFQIFIKTGDVKFTKMYIICYRLLKLFGVAL